jgi:hypothetical protein
MTHVFQLKSCLDCNEKIGFWISCVVCVLHHFVLVPLDLSSLLFFVFRLDLMQLDCLCSRIDFSSKPGLNFLDRE